MKYTNPIIKGFNPDPSICRVGEDYYLVTSTFEYFPGIPVYHSRNLVNWEMIGHCIERTEQLPLNNAISSGGIWAPTIRYHNGRFYVTATFDGKGNFIVSSDNPSTGWSDPVWTDFSGIDPSMLFDDGKMYYCANDIGQRSQYLGQGISAAQINPDTGEIIGEIRRVWNGEGGGWIEAPHIYHIGKYYYIIAAEGGTSAGHHEILGRSESLWGPYENCPQNPILTNRNDCSKQITCSGHGDLVDDTNGNWWMVHLGRRDVEGMSPLGRETFLMPIIWENDWFWVGESKMSRIEVDAPLMRAQKSTDTLCIDFDAPKWEKQWLFRRIPDTENYKRENGALILKPSPVKIRDDYGSPTFAALRPIDLKFSAQTEFDFLPRKNGDTAGMIVYLCEKFYYRICKKRENDKDYIIFERRIDDIFHMAYRTECEDGTLKMKIVSDGEKYHFSYSCGGEFINVGSGAVKLLSTDIAKKCFTGDLVGIFTECDDDTSAEMRVHNFEMKKDTTTVEFINGKSVNDITVTQTDLNKVYAELQTPYKYGMVVTGTADEGIVDVDCQGVFRYKNKWYMTYVSFDANKSIGYRTHLASSDDLINWTYEKCVFEQDENRPQSAAFPALQDIEWGGSNELETYDGKYWWTTMEGKKNGYEGKPMSIGLLSATDPSNVKTWTHEAEKVLSVDDEDVRNGEKGTLFKSTVIHDSEKKLGYEYVMYYNATNPDNIDWCERIFMAVSNDMKQWRRYGDGYVLYIKNQTITGDPQVVKMDDLWVMNLFTYKKNHSAYDTFAVSKDLLNWTLWNGKPTVEPSEDYDNKHSHKPWLIKHNGIVYHYYCARSDDGRPRGIALATSVDLKLHK